MKLSCVIAVAVLTTALAGCQTASTPPAAPPTSQMLVGAGFVQKKPTTAAHTAGLNSLPANQLVSQTVKGKTSYLFADPAGCNCVHVGDKDAMQNVMMQMNQAGPFDQAVPNLGPGGISDLDSWGPM
jgi:hypothetical protein